jgi:HK97 family phage major capsid protein
MAANTTANESLTAEIVASTIVPYVQQRSTFLSIPGLRIFDSPTGEQVRVPRMTGLGGAVTYVSEGSVIPDVTPVTDDLVLMPDSVHSFKTLIKVSEELVAQSVVSIEGAFTSALVEATANAIDSSLWAGAGSGGAPTGLTGFSGNVNAGTVAGTALASGHLFDMQEVALDNFLEYSGLVWALSPANFTRIRKMTDNYGARVLQPSLAAGAPDTILGSRFVVSTHIGDDGIWLFDPTKIAVGRGPTEVRVLTETFAYYGLVAYRVQGKVDVLPMVDEAVIALTIS